MFSTLQYSRGLPIRWTWLGNLPNYENGAPVKPCPSNTQRILVIQTSEFTFPTMTHSYLNPLLSFVLDSLPKLDPHLHRQLLNEHNHRKPVKLHALPGLIRDIKRPQESGHDKSQLDPRKRSS